MQQRRKFSFPACYCLLSLGYERAAVPPPCHAILAGAGSFSAALILLLHDRPPRRLRGIEGDVTVASQHVADWLNCLVGSTVWRTYGKVELKW